MCLYVCVFEGVDMCVCECVCVCVCVPCMWVCRCRFIVMHMWRPEKDIGVFFYHSPAILPGEGAVPEPKACTSGKASKLMSFQDLLAQT